MRNIFFYWDELGKKLSNKYIMLFLDYDGTLTPIVETPKKADISLSTKDLLKRLSEKKNCKIAIISGRALGDIKNKVGIKNIIYSGNHGLQIEGPKIKFEPIITQRYKHILQRIKTELEDKFSKTRGVFIEDKGLSLTLHFRLADEKQIPFIKTAFGEVVINYLVRGKIKIKSGKKVFEVRPPIEWNKGKIVLWLLARQQFVSGKNKVLPVYIGDDVTDEDAFKVLKRRGLTIFVGEPGNSAADYYLKDAEEVTRFLHLILNLKDK